jgi:hypothetical protein
LRIWSLGIPAVPNRSSNVAGLVSALIRILITASSISLSGEPPSLRAICSGIGDQRSGDIVAIASAFFDGV